MQVNEISKKLLVVIYVDNDFVAGNDKEEMPVCK